MIFVYFQNTAQAQKPGCSHQLALNPQSAVDAATASFGDGVVTDDRSATVGDCCLNYHHTLQIRRVGI